MPWRSERRSASGSSMQPPYTKLVRWRTAKAMDTRIALSDITATDAACSDMACTAHLVPCCHDAMAVRAQVSEGQEHAATPHEAGALAHSKGDGQRQVIDQAAVCENTRAPARDVKGISCIGMLASPPGMQPPSFLRRFTMLQACAGKAWQHVLNTPIAMNTS